MFYWNIAHLIFEAVFGTEVTHMPSLSSRLKILIEEMREVDNAHIERSRKVEIVGGDTSQTEFCACCKEVRGVTD